MGLPHRVGVGSMRAMTQDRRIEAIAGPVHFDLRGSDFGTLPETPDMPLTVAAVATAQHDTGGYYIFNSPTHDDGRRAYLYAAGPYGAAPTNWNSGVSGGNLGPVTPGVRQVVIGTLGRGIPARTASRQGVELGLERLIIWPRELTAGEQARVRQLLGANPLA